MNCKQCNRHLAEDECRKVADWIFCPDCFELLLRQADKKKTEKQDLHSTAPTETVRTACSVCEQNIEKDTERQMLGMTFCARCHAALVSRPSTPPSQDETVEEPQPVVPQVTVDTTAEARCSGCSRTIPVIGAKISDGKPYCPDCFYSLGLPADGDSREAGNNKLDQP